MTRDEKTGEVLECMRKIRLGDLNVYSPKREADWRVSVNLEVPGALAPYFFFWKYTALNFTPKKINFLVPHPVGGATHTRRKDRMSYSHEEFKIDLTQVTSSTSPNAPVNFFFKKKSYSVLVLILLSPL